MTPILKSVILAVQASSLEVGYLSSSRLTIMLINCPNLGWDVFATPMVGGLQHIAPEQILGTAYSGEKMDMWSAGIILYTLLVGRIPFRSTQPQQFLDDVKNVRYTIPDTVSSGSYICN